MAELASLVQRLEVAVGRLEAAAGAGGSGAAGGQGRKMRGGAGLVTLSPEILGRDPDVSGPPVGLLERARCPDSAPCLLINNHFVYIAPLSALRDEAKSGYSEDDITTERPNKSRTRSWLR